MTDLLKQDLIDLMLVPGLAGHEERVAAAIRARLPVQSATDRAGNVIATFPGASGHPSVMVFAHMDQLGFFVRRIDPDGMIRVERMGGVPERAMAAQPVLLCGAKGDLPGVIGNMSHHATPPEEKYRVLKVPEIAIDAGFGSRAEAEAAGLAIGTPVVWRPQALPLAGGRIAGTAIDDRAGCAVLLELARGLAAGGRAPRRGPTVHLVFTTQEEFNLRGALVAAQVLEPDIAIQIDLMLATDTPGMAGQGEMHLGGGPGMSLYSFHGRGTLNGTIPHPALVRLFEGTAARLGLPLQRQARTGVLTDNAYVQLVGRGVAAIDVGFPCRYTHSAAEVCDLADLASLARLLRAVLEAVPKGMVLERG
ncbi:MAG: M20/M25/M40 family metallo-hydrolase [Rhodobacteraceae bacterium]|nr:M20/M25/M40 family metallo-hydrolase [Paracoccaceae bacterium]